MQIIKTALMDANTDDPEMMDSAVWGTAAMFIEQRWSGGVFHTKKFLPQT